MMRAGFAIKDITPEIGARIPGGFASRASTGIHDPLQVRACVVTSPEHALAVVGVDAVSVPDDVVRAARSRIQIDSLFERDILIAASHTHSGGPANDVLGTDADPGYQDRLADAIAAAVQSAWAGRCPAVACVGAAPCKGWAFNRRWVMPDGSQRTNPGKGNPDVVKPAGPVDPDVGVLGFRRETDGLWLGAIAHFTCHCTVVGGTEFSADYPGFWRDELAAATGNPDFCMVFLNGACGDINQLDIRCEDVSETGKGWGRKMGGALAATTWSILQDAPARSAAAIGAAHADLTVPYRRLTRDQLAEARELASYHGNWEASHWLARDRLLLHERINDQEGRHIPLDLYRLGPVLLAAAPWQPFCQYGLRVKAAMPGMVMVVSFANGSVGYVPTPEGLAAGGYEPRLCRGSCLAAQTGGLIVAELCALAPELLRQAGEA